MSNFQSSISRRVKDVEFSIVVQNNVWVSWTFICAVPGTPEVKGINLSDLQVTDSRRKKNLAGGPPLRVGGSPGQIFNSAQTDWKITPPQPWLGGTWSQAIS